jgi:tripartite-type tricarboxylate transporter receptor subunit TctC
MGAVLHGTGPPALIGRTVSVENKPGGNGLIATEYVARAKPDGYTMLMQSPTSLAANMFMFKNPTIDVKTALVTVVKFTRDKGEKTTFATAAAPGRLMGNLFKEIMELKCVEVQYRTGQEALNEMRSDAVDFMFADGVFAHAEAAKGILRILAVGSKERMKADPNVPTMDEEGVRGLDVPGFFGTLVPIGTPRPVIERINSWLVGIMKNKATLDFIRQSGGDPLVTTPDEAEQLFLQAIEDWGRLVKLSKIEPQG